MSKVIVVPEVKEGVSITPDAIELKNQLLEISKPIVSITTVEEGEHAVKVSRNLRTHLADVEKARKDVKEPILKMGRQIDEAAKTHCAELDKEMDRINRLFANFETERRRKEQEEIERQQRDLARLQKEAEEAERKRLEAEKALEKAKPKDRAALMSEEFDAEEARLAAEEQKRKLELQEVSLKLEQQVSKPTGGALRTNIEIEVTDVHALYKAHPTFCRVEADLGTIKFFITTQEAKQDGKPVEIPGVRYSKVASFSARRQ